jgi:ABC-type Fe3+-hydroxamate transport system substrate-binding protein
MRIFSDQCGNRISLPRAPSRIVSLVPSQTELLHDLGLGNEVVGITKFCVHPASWKKEKAIIGGTKNFNFDVIDELQPDLIIGNKEENYKEGIEALQKKYNVWMSDIFSLDDALEMIEQVGEICERQEKATEIVDEIRSSFNKLSSAGQQRVLYLIWKGPWMCAGKNTFIDSMLLKIGFVNAVIRLRYPELASAEIADLHPDIIFLSSEPYPFKDKHISSLQEICPRSKVMLVDGEMFSWYGSRLRLAVDYFNGVVGRINKK